MINKQTGPLEVRPNTLRDQTAPNTLRSQAGPGSAGKQDLNSGGGTAARRRPRPGLRSASGCTWPWPCWWSSSLCTC